MSDEQDEWFRATNSWVWAALAAAIAVLVAVIDAVQGWHPAVTAGAVLFVLIGYASFLRPQIGVRGSDLVLHHLYSTQAFPLAALEKVEIGRTMALYAGGHRFVFGAIGRSARSTRRAARGQGAGAAGTGRSDPERKGTPSAHARPAVPTEYADLVDARITARARDARDRAGIKAGSPEQQALATDVARTWDWPLIALTVLAAVAFVVLFVWQPQV